MSERNDRNERVNVAMLEVGERFVSAKSGVTLTVAERFNGNTYATQDGRGFHRGVWHDGDEAGSVWAEVWDKAGFCQFHGTVDSVSRRVTQVG